MEPDSSRRRKDKSSPRGKHDHLHKLESLFEHADCAVATVHPDTHVLDLVNPAFARMHGFEVEELAGRPLVNTCAPESLEDALKHTRRALAQDSHDYECVNVRKDGSTFLAQIHVAAVKDERGQVLFRAVTVQDITERKRLESNLQRLDELTAVNRSKDEFIAMLSHELRSPLNVIRLWAQILERPGRSEERLREGLEVIDRSSRMQAKLIEDLLDVHRITTGDLRLELAEIDLSDLTRSVVDSMAPSAAEKQIRIVREIEPEFVPVHGDSGRLQQVLANLFGNAVKFTPKGGEIRVVLRRADAHAEVSVRDTGQGIRPEELPHLFERFRRSQPRRGSGHSGLGLGLSIAKRLVDLHGGTIVAHSSGAGTGATFTVAIPLLSANAMRPAVVAGASGKESPVSLVGVVVLVVDDEPDTREAVQRVLEHAGVQTLAAGSVDQALDVIRQKLPDVIVSDIGMPGRDGYDFVRSIRALPEARGGRIPAIALTAYVTSEDRERALGEGFQKHLSKPVESRELIAAVASLAPKRSERRSQSSGS